MDIPASKDKALFTPGPLTTSRTVKQAMLRDLGSRDDEFIAIVSDIRARLLDLAGVDDSTHAAILLPGSGTYALEAVVGSTIPADGKLLIAINGAYGKRLEQIAKTLKIDVTTLVYPENRPVNPDDIARALAEDAAISQVSCCHCETTSGIINPVEEIGSVVARAGRAFFLDAMSTFGAVPLDMRCCRIDYLVSSANKCIEGVPGFSFVLADVNGLRHNAGQARSLSLDLAAQHDNMDKTGQFRFTPPTHTLLAFHRALQEHDLEGGVWGRAQRYRQNHATLLEGMRRLGFEAYLADDEQGYIITSFYYPADPLFSFAEFYAKLAAENCVIYPGKVGDADCFRIGNIGRLFADDMENLLSSISRILNDMGVEQCGREG